MPVFRNLSDEKIKELYVKLKEQGLNEDEIFNEIYSIDCNLDNKEK